MQKAYLTYFRNRQDHESTDFLTGAGLLRGKMKKRKMQKYIRNQFFEKSQVFVPERRGNISCERV